MANFAGSLTCPVVTITQANNGGSGREGVEGNAEQECNVRQNLQTQQSCQSAQSADDCELDISNDEEEDFWSSISSLRTTLFGISMWCIGWNLVAIFLSPQYCWRFAPVLFLGVMLTVTGFHAQKISHSRSYKRLFVLMPVCFAYIMCGFAIMYRSVGDALQSFVYNEARSEFTYNSRPETFMSIGNFVLMCFVCYCNALALKLACEKIGSWFDHFDAIFNKVGDFA